jgi:hypothetical protein
MTDPMHYAANKPVILPALLAICAVSHAQGENLSFQLRPAESRIDWRAPAREMILSDESYQLELALNPLKTDWNHASGSSTRNVSQDFAVIWRQSVADDASLRYETTGGYQSQWQDSAPQPGATAQQGVRIGQKLSLVWQWMKNLSVTPFAQGQRFYAGDSDNPSDALGAGIESSAAPWQDANLRAQIAVQEKFGFDRSITLEQLAGGTFEQKLPAAPFKLKLAGAATQTDAESPALSDSTTLKGEGALQWLLPGNSSLGVGMSFQKSAFDLASTVENTGSQFADLRLQPAAGLTLSSRTAWETRTRETPAADAAAQSVLALTLGMSWRVNDAVDAGFALQHRIPQEGQPPDAQSETVFSFSASGNF